MKSNRVIFAAACFMAYATAAAQSQSAYFLDNYTYGYQMNPAHAIERKVDFSVPALGNLNLSTFGNVGLKNFIYNIDGKTVTFMHPDVSTSEFMKGIKNNNRLGTTDRVGIMNVGFKGLGGYNHVSINTVVNTQARVPKDIFSFLKEGASNRTYHIGNIDAHADAYAEIALNHSHSLDNVVKGLRIGGTFKFLVGIGNVDINLDKADLELGENAWTATTAGASRVSLKNFSYKTRYDDVSNRNYVDGIDYSKFSAPNGYGVALDLGASYRMSQDWDFALSFTDIGFINWSNDMVATTNGNRTFTTADHSLDITDSDVDSSWEPIRKDLTGLYQLDDMGDQGSRCRALEATMYASARYTLHAYRGLTFGLLNVTRMAHRYAWTEFRLSAQVTPVKWFSAGINYGVGTFGSSFGWILNIAPKGFNLFVGMDHTLGKLSKQYIPLNSNSQLSFGVNFPI